jgi:hypothetical protein
MVDVETSLGQHLLDIPKGDLVLEIPTDAE